MSIISTARFKYANFCFKHFLDTSLKYSYIFYTETLHKSQKTRQIKIYTFLQISSKTCKSFDRCR